MIDAVDHHYAGVFLVTSDGRVLGQRRDNDPTIDNPGKVAAFGGTVEHGETPLMAAWRELTQEETNLELPVGALQPLVEDVSWRSLTREWQGRHFYFAVITTRQENELEVYEGVGAASIADANDADLIDGWRKPVALLFVRLAS